MESPLMERKEREQRDHRQDHCLKQHDVLQIQKRNLEMRQAKHFNVPAHYDEPGLTAPCTLQRLFAGRMSGKICNMPIDACNKIAEVW